MLRPDRLRVIRSRVKHIMGDLADIPAGGDAGGTDVTGGSSPSTTTDVSTTTDTGAANDVFADHDFDKEFGLPAEEKPTPDVSPDVTKDPDPPATRQGEEIEREGADTTDKSAEGETAKAPEEDKTEATEPDKEGQFKANEKLNWDDDKVPFREEFKNLKTAYLELLNDSLEAKFISNPADLVTCRK